MKNTSNSSFSTNSPINIQELDALKTLLGPYFIQTVEVYLSTSQNLMSSLSIAWDKQDANEVGKAAHDLKSSSAQLGAQSLSEMARLIEELAYSGMLPAEKILLENIIEQHKSATDALKGFLVASS